MKCFYHEDREAVGSCQSCGKSLCRECASAYTPLTCEDCHRSMVARSINEREKQKQLDISNSKSKIIRTLVVGTIFGVIMAGFMISSGSSLEIVIFWFFMGIGLPFGWSQTKAIPIWTSNGEPVNFFLAFIFNIFKFVLACLVGIPVAIYRIVTAILAYREAKNREIK